MPKATPRDIAKSIEEHNYKIPAKYDRLVDNKTEPETDHHRIERERYWRSLRKRVAQGPAVKIRDGRLIGFTGRGR